jgi:hypothetical protein
MKTETERAADLVALQDRRAARGMSDPLNRMRAIMAESAAPVITEQPAPHVLAFEAGIQAERDGVTWWNNPHESGSVLADSWDRGHTAARQARARGGV